jgi:hypothetical protein
MRKKSAPDQRRRAEALLGPRGKLKFPLGYRDDDPRVAAIREWVIANRFPPWSVFEFKFFSIKEVTRAYNDTSGKGLDAFATSSMRTPLVMRAGFSPWTLPHGVSKAGPSC